MQVKCRSSSHRLLEQCIENTVQVHHSFLSVNPLPVDTCASTLHHLPRLWQSKSLIQLLLFHTVTGRKLWHYTVRMHSPILGKPGCTPGFLSLFTSICPFVLSLAEAAKRFISLRAIISASQCMSAKRPRRWNRGREREKQGSCQKLNVNSARLCHLRMSPLCI